MKIGIKKPVARQFIFMGKRRIDVLKLDFFTVE
jgi:hypothetical protein